MSNLIIFGASGRTGLHLVEQALAQGFHVTAFVRSPSKLPMKHERLRVIQGDVMEPQAVENAIAGHDAVLSVLGPAKGSSKEMLRSAARNIISAMERHGVRRYVGLTGAGVAAPGDPSSMGRMIMLSLLKLLARDLLEDSEQSVQIITGSDRNWTYLRAPVLTNGPRTGKYRTGTLKMGPGARASRADVADCMLRLLKDQDSYGKMPMICY